MVGRIEHGPNFLDRIEVVQLNLAHVNASLFGGTVDLDGVILVVAAIVHAQHEGAALSLHVVDERGLARLANASIHAIGGAAGHGGNLAVRAANGPEVVGAQSGAGLSGDAHGIALDQSGDAGRMLAVASAERELIVHVNGNHGLTSGLVLHTDFLALVPNSAIAVELKLYQLRIARRSSALGNGVDDDAGVSIEACIFLTVDPGVNIDGVHLHVGLGLDGDVGLIGSSGSRSADCGGYIVEVEGVLARGNRLVLAFASHVRVVVSSSGPCASGISCVRVVMGILNTHGVLQLLEVDGTGNNATVHQRVNLALGNLNNQSANAVQVHVLAGNRIGSLSGGVLGEGNAYVLQSIFLLEDNRIVLGAAIAGGNGNLALAIVEGVAHGGVVGSGTEDLADHLVAQLGVRNAAQRSAGAAVGDSAESGGVKASIGGGVAQGQLNGDGFLLVVNFIFNAQEGIVGGIDFEGSVRVNGLQSHVIAGSLGLGGDVQGVLVLLFHIVHGTGQDDLHAVSDGLGVIVVRSDNLGLRGEVQTVEGEVNGHTSQSQHLGLEAFLRHRHPGDGHGSGVVHGGGVSAVGLCRCCGIAVVHRNDRLRRLRSRSRIRFRSCIRSRSTERNHCDDHQDGQEHRK